MNLLCPDCLGTLESSDGGTARCTTHGGLYQVLFTRQPLALPPRSASLKPPILAEGATCAQHPSVAAAYACICCSTPICQVCDFAQPDGSHWCPNCAHKAAVSPPPILSDPPAQPQLAAGMHCVQHPHLPATGQCKVCGAFMCGTCAFDLPGGIKVCPTCATTPQTALSPKRKKMLLGSYALAIWCTVVMGAMFAGLFRNMITDKASQQAVGMLLMIILLAP